MAKQGNHRDEDGTACNLHRLVPNSPFLEVCDCFYEENEAYRPSYPRGNRFCEPRGMRLWLTAPWVENMVMKAYHAVSLRRMEMSAMGRERTLGLALSTGAKLSRIGKIPRLSHRLCGAVTG